MCEREGWRNPKGCLCEALPRFAAQLKLPLPPARAAAADRQSSTCCSRRPRSRVPCRHPAKSACGWRNPRLSGGSAPGMFRPDHCAWDGPGAARKVRLRALVRETAFRATSALSLRCGENCPRGPNVDTAVLPPIHRVENDRSLAHGAIGRHVGGGNEEVVPTGGRIGLPESAASARLSQCALEPRMRREPIVPAETLRRVSLAGSTHMAAGYGLGTAIEGHRCARAPSEAGRRWSNG